VNLITKMPPRVYMQRVRRNRGIYCDVKTLKCTSVFVDFSVTDFELKSSVFRLLSFV